MRVADTSYVVIGSIVLFSLTTPCRAATNSSLEIVLGVKDDGKATEQWLTMLRKRLPPSEYSALAMTEKQLSAAESKWAELIRSREALWNGRQDSLATTFAPAKPPARVLVVMGNRGGDDAFTHDAITIGLDLSALQSTYGDAGLPENLKRIDRFFNHEYTHLMQKAWLADHPYEAGSPLRATLLDIWLEGLGNYHSLSDSWRSTPGRSSKVTEVLAVLEPRFVARLSALACASSDGTKPLMRDLSTGPFEKKWGALPVALWLEAEASSDPEALRRFVLGGPDGVWDLAQRHLSEPLRNVFKEARLAASMCSNRSEEVAPADSP
jgi:hypothetical protein